MAFIQPKFEVFSCLPTSGALFSYVQYASRVATNGSRIYHLGSAVPILFNEMNLRGIYLAEMMDQGQARPFTAFALLLGRSADGKSTSAMTALKHIVGVFDAEDDDNQRWKPKRALEFDGTPEGLRYELVTQCFNPDRRETVALVYNEEFTAVFQRSHGAVAEFLLRMYDGRDLNEAQRQHQRASTEGVHSHGTLQGPKINGLFCSTPDYLTKVVSQAMASGGLYGRLLVFSGEERRQPYEGSIVGNQQLLDQREHWRNRNENDLRAWSRFLDELILTNGGCLTLSEEAHDVFRARHEMYQDLIKEGKFDDNMRAMLGRATRTAWMVGALFATTRHEYIVSADDARRATKLVDYCFSTGEEFSSMFEQTETAKRQRAVLNAIRKAKTQGVPKSNIHAAPGINGKGVRKIELQDILDTLEDAEVIVRVSVKPESGRGRPATVYFAKEYAPEDNSEKN